MAGAAQRVARHFQVRLIVACVGRVAGGTDQFRMCGLARGQAVGDNHVTRETESLDIASVDPHSSVNGLCVAVVAVASGERAVLEFIDKLR